MPISTRLLSNRLALAGLITLLLSGLAAPPARAQSVWSGGDDRGSFWSDGRVVDGNGNVVHVGNWSGGPAPGNGADVYLGAPGGTLCDVDTAPNSLTLAPGGSLIMDYGSALTVTTTNLAIDGTIYLGGGGGAGPSYTNAGTLTKSAGTGTSAFDMNITLNSLAGTTITAASGTLQLPGAGSGVFDTVAFVPAAGATINLVTPAGNGNPGSAHFQGTLSNGTGTGTVLLDTGATMSGGSAPTTLAFTGSAFQWTGGVIGSYQQRAIFTNVGVVTITGGGTKETYAAFTNQGTVIQNDVGEFHVGYYNSGGSFTNAAGAVYDLQSDANIGQSSYLFNNAGLFKKSGGTGTCVMTVSFQNQGGTVEVDSGTLQLPVDNSHGISTGGTFNVAAGAALDLGGNGFFTGTYTGGGAGIVRLSQGTLLADKPNATIFNFPGAFFQWTGGTIGSYQGGQVFTNVGTINITGGGTKETDATFTNQGLVVQNDVGEFHVGDANSGGSFTNAAGGVYDLQSDANLGQGGYPFNNVGLFKKSGGTGTSTMSVAFNNQGGTVEVDSGTLQLPVGQNSTSTGGTFNVAAGAVLDLGDGQHFTGTYTGGGAGTVRLSQGTLYPDKPAATVFNFPGSLFQWTSGTIGGYQGGRVFTNIGTINISGDATKLTEAVFTNQGVIIQTGAGTFNIGDANSGGSFTNAAGATYNLASDAAIGENGYPFTNAGLFEKTAGGSVSKMDVELTNTGTVAALTGSLNFTQRIDDIKDTTLTEGTWVVDDGAAIIFANYTDGITINQASVTLNGPNASFPAIDKLTDNQGSFSLLALKQFTTAGDLTNEGTIFLDAGSTLHVAGNFTASDAAPSGTGTVGRTGGPHIQAAPPSTIHFTVGGTAAQGVQSPGVLQMAGTAKMAGLMEIALAKLAATPGAGDTLTVLSAGSVTGSFDNAPNGTRLATTDGRGSFLVTYGATSIGLSKFLTPNQTASTPTVTIAVVGDGDAVEGGENGKVAIRRDGDLTNALTVRYKVAGGVRAGTDYKPLPGVATIPAGAAQVKIKIKPIDDGTPEGTRIAKVKLKPAADGSYALGSVVAAKVHIIDND